MLKAAYISYNGFIMGGATKRRGFADLNDWCIAIEDAPVGR